MVQGGQGPYSGFHAALTASVEAALATARGGPMLLADVHDVLIVGGSTLLPKSAAGFRLPLTAHNLPEVT